LGSEPDTGFTAVRGNSIVEQAADRVDVVGDRDRQQDFVRSDSRRCRHDISCRRAVFGMGADGPRVDPHVGFHEHIAETGKAGLYASPTKIAGRGAA
jgi:hypothetical protein